MAEIKEVFGRQILDSRGNPTVEVELTFTAGNRDQKVRTSVPSGASTGELEAHELRDGEGPYGGKGVTKAVDNINNIIKPKIVGMDCTSQEEIDNTMNELDGTANKTKLGANAILGVSMAAAKAAAESKGLPLYLYLGTLSNITPEKIPIPVLNIINGGAHAGNSLEFQEFMIIPSGAKTFSEAIQMGAETYASLKQLLLKRFGRNAINIGDEGGFAPPLKREEEPFELIMDVLTELGYKDKIKLGIDAAASGFCKDNKYLINEKSLDTGELLEFYKDLKSKYPIVSMEDPFDEEDWEGFINITKELGNNTQIVGDDLFVTNVKRIRMGIEKNACNSVLLKVNQIGTVTESIQAALMAFENDYTIMVSHRSGETEDTFISDLAVSLNCGEMKSGAPARTDRTAKYNQLLRIEEQLGDKSRYGDVKHLSG